MRSINRLFIANRGEIAARIIRSSQRLGIHCILGVSEADRESLPARQADEVVLLGPSPSSRSYLLASVIADAASKSGADAVHPGYGFLSENAELARACRERNIEFIGPTEATLEAIGNKLSAREHALKAGLNLVSGEAIYSLESAEALAEKTGYPLLIKAVSGGGGRGMQVVNGPDELTEEIIGLAMSEAEQAFGDSRLYMERYIRQGRHVEVQVLGDGHTVIHLGTRDCSIQRRYQKLVEEAPAPNLKPELREALHEAAVAFASHLNYLGAGTVEFLVDTDTDSFYFLEMNARIQVEHPVTEAICGIDLIAEQIRLAEGRPLRLSQEEIRFNGHAIECRLNAEDETRGFMPDPGTLTNVVWPAGEGVRVDTHVEAGIEVPPYYDSLIAKLIVSGSNREESLQRLQSSLSLVRLEGTCSNLQMHRKLIASKAFCAGGVTTAFLSDFLQGGDHD